MSELFDRAFEIVVGFEGGYSNHEEDAGGETKWGISSRQYPDEDIKNMTKDRAATLYYNDYWLPLQAFELPDRIAVMLFDMAVNMGRLNAVRVLQRAVGVKDDGWLGPITRSALKAKQGPSLMEEITVQRIMYYTRLNFDTFGLGWVRRSVRLLGQLA